MMCACSGYRVEVVNERARQFRDAAEAERRGIATAIEAFFSRMGSFWSHRQGGISAGNDPEP